jgi:exopolysaccharide production protein ExoQ
VSTQEGAQSDPRWRQMQADRGLVFRQGAPREPRARLVALRVMDLEFATAFCLFASMLFVSQLGSLGGLFVVTVTASYVLLHITRLYEILAPRAFLLLIPAVILMSTLWSETRSETLKYGIEFAFTAMAGLMLSASRRPMSVLFGMFLAFSFYIAVSLAFGQEVYVGNTGTTAFSGLNRGKNLLADIATTGSLISAAMFLVSFAERRFLLTAAALVATGMQLYAVVAARSAGAMLGLAIAAAVFTFLLAMRPLGTLLRATATFFLGLVLLIAALNYRALSSALIETGARFFDKDLTLTGRTYLWQRADDLIAETPWLGKGFHSFWLQGNPDAEGLWQYAGITSREGFNFHNAAIEILVHLGWFGLIVYSLVVVIGLGFLIARFLARPNLFICFWLSLFIYELVRMPIESIGITEFYFSTVLLFMALGSPFAAPPTRQHAARAPQPRQVPPGRPVAQASLRT